MEDLGDGRGRAIALEDDGLELDRGSTAVGETGWGAGSGSGKISLNRFGSRRPSLRGRRCAIDDSSFSSVSVGKEVWLRDR
jgi:hypothetical protein